MKLIPISKIKELVKKYKEVGLTIVFVTLILVFTNVIGNLVFSTFTDSKSSDGISDSSDLSSQDNCNVQGISIHGEVFTYDGPDVFNDQDKIVVDQTSADKVIWGVNEGNSNPNIKAILVEIDSSGGSPVAGEEIMRAFKESKKPVIAFVRNMALSTAYLGATGADVIFVSRFSDVGSIGITMSYLQNTEKNKKDGLEFVTLSSGKYKDSGSPDRVLTTEERQMFMRDINIGRDYFVELVAKNRNLSIEKVGSLADGSSLLGEMALKEGLVDKIGTFQDVRDYISEKIGEKVEVCW